MEIIIYIFLSGAVTGIGLCGIIYGLSKIKDKSDKEV